MLGENSPLQRRTARGQARLVPENSSNLAARTLSTLSMIEEATIKAVLAKAIDFMDSPEFRKRGAAKKIYDKTTDVDPPDVTWYRPLMDDFTPARSRSGGAPRKKTTVILTQPQERALFLKFNYARFQLKKIQDKLDGRPPSDKIKREVLKWHRVVCRYREQISESNLALVLAMAKRTRMSDVDFADLVSEGNMALMRSVDKFDCERGFKFSTYACRAILKSFSRQGMKNARYRQRFPTEFDPAFEKSDHLEKLRASHVEESAMEVKHIVLNNEAELSDVELAVLEHRFGVSDSKEEEPKRALTLEQVGQIIGVTKERVRQIQNKALAKIRTLLDDNENRTRGSGAYATEN
jgi:RNA polymerase sigma factor (sigma-70 family)